jgi:hypothetical protein
MVILDRIFSVCLTSRVGRTLYFRIRNRFQMGQYPGFHPSALSTGLLSSSRDLIGVGTVDTGLRYLVVAPSFSGKNY